MLNSEKNKIVMRGISLSSGVAIAKAILMDSQVSMDFIETNRISVANYKDEIAKFNLSREKCIEQIEELMSKTAVEDEISEILLFQKILMKDQSFINNVKHRAEAEKINIEFIIITELKKIKEQFDAAEAEIIRTKFHDIQDIYHRLICNLLEIEQFSESTIRDISHPFILVSKQLFPSSIASLNRDLLQGIIMEQGSVTSHVAIMAKTYEIPAITGVFEIYSKLDQGDEIIIDGNKGIVILSPTLEELEKYRVIKNEIDHDFSKHVNKVDEIKFICNEQIPFSIEANASFLKDAKEGYLNGASGVGLFRSEFFYMISKTLPEVDEELKLYRSLAELDPDKPVTIRLLDVGGDKMPFYLPMPPDPVPQLGFRGIRYLLNYPELLKRQLKNIILASAYGKVKLLIPFITVLEDIDRTLFYIGEVLSECNIDRSNIEIGIMVEIPSVALGIESYLDRIDFISIGTNDLSQYLFAVSRDASQLNGYHCTVHPVMLKLLASVIRCADEKGKEVTICGEIASDPFIAGLLVGIGARSLSMNPSSIEPVRKKLFNSSIKYLEEMAQKALEGEKFIDILNIILKI